MKISSTILKRIASLSSAMTAVIAGSFISITATAQDTNETSIFTADEDNAFPEARDVATDENEDNIFGPEQNDGDTSNPIQDEKFPTIIQNISIYLENRLVDWANADDYTKASPQYIYETYFIQNPDVIECGYLIAFEGNKPKFQPISDQKFEDLINEASTEYMLKCNNIKNNFKSEYDTDSIVFYVKDDNGQFVKFSTIAN